MNNTTERTLSELPEVTLLFWIMKIAATTLGETGGDAVSMSMNLGYLVGTVIFAAIFLEEWVKALCPNLSKYGDLSFFGLSFSSAHRKLVWQSSSLSLS
jgi:uncharacterized membrane-anchored protein